MLKQIMIGCLALAASAMSQAQEHSHSTEQELDLLVVHGVLHLMGYDHADEEEKSTMWARQDAILSSLP